MINHSIFTHIQKVACLKYEKNAHYSRFCSQSIFGKMRPIHDKVSDGYGSVGEFGYSSEAG